MNTYKTYGTCASRINFSIKDGKIEDVEFVGGCGGNTKGIKSLVIGMDVDSVIDKLKGIPCRGNTSCPDQLAKALEEYKTKSNLENK